MVQPSSSNVQLTPCATLKGHKGWVTCIACPADPTQNFVVSGSRDKTAIVWEVTRDRENFATAKKSLHGHNHFVHDISLSRDGLFAITSSSDKTMRLWNLAEGKTEVRFVGHNAEVLSVSFSPDNRLIVSGSRDKSIKIWNTRGQLKGDFSAPNRSGASTAGHSEWVSCVRFSPDAANPLVVSSGWDRVVKVWDLKSQSPHLSVNHFGHGGYINVVAISPDGTLCASGGKDGTVMLWDLNASKHLYSLEAGDVINCLVFSPMRYWLCAATESSIKIWDLLSKNVVDDIKLEAIPGVGVPRCVSLAWSADGSTLYAGCTDNAIRVWQVTTSQFS